MKNLIALIMVMVAFITSNAQTTSASVTLNKISQPAMKVDIPVDDDVSEDFFVSNLKKMGYSDKNMFSKQNKIDEGFYSIKGVKLDGMNEPVDLYVKMEQKGKKSNHESTIWMLISKEGGFITSSSDRNSYAAAETFLNGFVNQALAYKLKKAIAEQQEITEDAEKKLRRQQDHEKDMERKIENLQKDLKENREDQRKQEKTIEEEKKKLEDLKEQAKKYS